METFFPAKLASSMTEVSVPRTSALPTQVTVIASGTPHTKGDWVEVLASTGAKVDAIVVIAGGTAAATTDTAALLDIGTGTAGNEVVRIPNLNVGYRAGTVDATTAAWVIPLRIASGIRIAARFQAAVASEDLLLSVEAYGGRFYNAFNAVTQTAYGADTGTSRGVVVPGGTSGAEGDWTEITSATSKDHRGLLVSMGGAGDTVMIANAFTYDVGIGAPASEVAISSDRLLGSSTAEFYVDNDRGRLIAPRFIPGGTRLSVRMSGLSATGQSADFILHGLN